MYVLNPARQPDAEAHVDMFLEEYRKLEPDPIEVFIFFDHPGGRTGPPAPFDPELVLRDIPGKLLQRSWQAQRLGWPISTSAFQDSPGNEVVCISIAP